MNFCDRRKEDQPVPRALASLSLAGKFVAIYPRPVSKENKLHPERGREVAGQLNELGVQGILITGAEKGYITELRCQMPECLCPEELGGRSYFEPVTGDLPDRMPTHEHFPRSKAKGGHRTVDNALLAHRLCNRVDYSKSIGRFYTKDLARVEAARLQAIERAKKSPEK